MEQLHASNALMIGCIGVADNTPRRSNSVRRMASLHKVRANQSVAADGGITFVENEADDARTLGLGRTRCEREYVGKPEIVCNNVCGT